MIVVSLVVLTDSLLLTESQFQEQENLLTYLQAIVSHKKFYFQIYLIMVQLIRGGMRYTAGIGAIYQIMGQDDLEGNDYKDKVKIINIFDVVK